MKMQWGKAARCALGAVVGMTAFAGVAHAQAPTLADDSGYVQVFAQSAFGNVTSQSYGGEIGVAVSPSLQVFIEAGQVRNVATEQIGAAAQTIATALTQLQPAAVDYSVRQPVTFFAAGVRYPIAMPGAKLHPYVLGGFGVARVKNDVTFQIGGVDSSIDQYVTLGDDLSGSVTKPMVTLGGGVVWPAWRQLAIDVQFRYGRIFTEGSGTNIGRAGLGLGYRF